MMLSRYCLIYKDPCNTENIILFSTKNSSKIIIPAKMLTDIYYENLSDEERMTLSELGFLIESGQEERTNMLSFFKDINTTDSIFSVQIVTNLDCNFDCIYCFEGSRKGDFYITWEIAFATVEYIKENSPEWAEELRIIFYGGEPLLSKDMVLYISDRIKNYANEKGIRYTGKLITNGTLLTIDTVTHLVRSGVRTVSVTIDGPESVHDTARPFRGGKGSFRSIMRNLKETNGLIDLEISGNYTRSNYKHFPELIDILIAEGLTPDKVTTLQFYPVIQEAEGIVNCHFKDGCNSINEQWLFEADVFLREEILKRGYKTSRIIPSVCMIEIKNSFIVNYNGDIYKCPGLIGREEFKIGNIRTCIIDYHESYNLNNWKNDRCLDCSYLPLCFGGCRYMKYLRDGNMGGVDCRRQYFDATLESLVKQDIKYGLTQA